MERAEDRRIRMTKRILKETLVEMMKTKSVAEISIKKICEAADINRSTFYHHYQSTIELYNDIINDITTDLNTILIKEKEKNSSHSELIAEMLSYVESRRDLFLVILSDKGNITVGERLTTIVERYINADNSSELTTYCVQFITAGVANILWLWLNKEERLPPKTVANLITTIMQRGVKRAVAVSARDGII